MSISSRDHAVEIELNTGEKFLVNCKVSDLLPQLDERFLKLRRGFIVNMEYIEHMNAEGCTLRCGETETRVIPAEAFPVWAIVLLVLLGILLVGGAAVLVIVVKRKKQA